MSVRYEIKDGFMEIVLDTPPVNVIGLETRIGLSEALDLAETSGIKRIIITGEGGSLLQALMQKNLIVNL